MKKIKIKQTEKTKQKTLNYAEGKIQVLTLFLLVATLMHREPLGAELLHLTPELLAVRVEGLGGLAAVTSLQEEFSFISR